MAKQKEGSVTGLTTTKVMFQKKSYLDQVCGAHFNQKGHTVEDMLPTIVEQVYPTNDMFLRLKREKFWINTYEECANKQS